MSPDTKSLNQDDPAIVWVAALSANFSSETQAQSIHHIFDGEAGWSIGELQSIDDIDGDGVPDLVASSNISGVGLGALVVAISGVTFQEIWRVGPGIELPGGLSCGRSETVILGDFNGDGFRDLAIGCPVFLSGAPSRVLVLDGLTGNEITRVSGIGERFGKSIGAPGDTNGDGLADLIVAENFGVQRVYLAPDATLAFEYSNVGELGLGAGGIGDIDGDGGDDFALGWGNYGEVTVYSGRTGALRSTLCVTETSLCLGEYGAFPIGLGDLDGDLVPDFVVSAANVGLSDSRNGVGVVRVISGQSFQTIHRINGRPLGGGYFDLFGAHLGGGTDVNGDGFKDFTATAATTGSPGSASVISGRTGQILYQARSIFDGGVLDIGSFVIMANTLHDLDGDGYAEWCVGSDASDVGGLGSGRVYIFKGGPGDVEHVCDALPHSQGQAARIHLYGAITENTRGLEVRIEDAIPGSFASIIYGPRAASSPFGDGMLCIDSQAVVRYAAPVQLDPTGYAIRSIDWGYGPISHPATGWRFGTSWTVQAVFRDTGGTAGFNTTNAIEVSVNR